MGSKGYLPFWSSRTAYTNTSPSTPSATSIVQTRTGVYQNTAAQCASASFGSGPSGKGNGIADGTCFWNYLGNSLNAGGTTFSIATRSMAGGGPQWGMATAHTIDGGFGKGQVYGQEFDCTNNNEDSFAGSSFGFTCLYFGGNNTHRSYAAIEIDNSGRNQTGGYQYGLVADGQPGDKAPLAVQSVVEDFSTSPHTVQAYAGRTKSSALQDDSGTTSSPTGATIAATGTKVYGLDFSGATITGKLINFPGFNVYSDGGTAIRSKTASTSTATGSLTTKGGLGVAGAAHVGEGLWPGQYTVANAFQCNTSNKGAMIVFTDVSGNPSYRQTRFSGGGTQAVPGFCNGASWELH